MLSIIAAVAKNGAIGLDNKLLWHISEDLKRFKAITHGKTIIMGRKTFESLPGILPDRKHIVVTNKGIEDKSGNVSICNNLNALLEELSLDKEEAFVIGGESVYAQAMPYCNKLYLTIVEKDFEGDTFFPTVDYDVWRSVEKSGVMTDKSGLAFYYHTLVR